MGASTRGAPVTVGSWGTGTPPTDSHPSWLMVAVTAGGAQSVMLAANGWVYTCGNGRRGRLGHGDEENQLTPKLVGALTGEQVVGVGS